MSTPIHTLPPELLAEIFKHAVFAEHRKKDLPKVMLVCRKWRAIVVDTTVFWTKIEIESNQPIELFARRARGSPLLIRGELEDEDDMHLERTLLLLGPTYLPRLRDISITFGYGYDDDDAAPILDILLAEDTHAPQLENFALSCRWSKITPGDVAGIIIHQASRLRTVVLNGFSFPWGLSLPNLYMLDSWSSTANIRGVASGPYQLMDILHSLSSMPLLEELVLSDFLPPLFRNGMQVVREHGHSAVSMRKLYTLELEGSGEEAFVLWMLLECCPNDIHVTSRDMVSPALVAAALDLHVRRISMDINSRCCLKVWQTDNPPNQIDFGLSDPFDDWSPRLFLHTATLLPDRLSLHLLRAASPLLRNVHTLEIRGTAWMQTYTESAPLLALAQNLHTLTISGMSPLKAFISLLLTPGSREEGCTNATLPFPSLAEMDISDANFTMLLDAEHHPRRPLGEHLSSVLDARDKAGRRLRLLYVEGCVVLRRTVETWKTAVEKMEWDGQTEQSGIFYPGDLEEEG